MKNKLFFIPGLFTLLNLFFGFFSIVKTINGQIDVSAWFIIFAVLCDAWDGKVARLTNSESNFGFEFDSFADLISSGLAPSLLIFRGGLVHFKALGVFICFFYIFAGTYRLSRYNLLNKEKRINGYTGLPLPVSAVTIAALWIFKSPFGEQIADAGWIVLLLFLSLLMMSTIRYSWPVLNFKNGYKQRAVSIFFLLGTGLLVLFPRKYLFPLIMIYILYGVVRKSFKMIFKNKNTKNKGDN